MSPDNHLYWLAFTLLVIAAIANTYSFIRSSREYRRYTARYETLKTAIAENAYERDRLRTATRAAATLHAQITDINDYVITMATLGYHRRQALDMAIECAKHGISITDVKTTIDNRTNGTP